MSEPTRDPIRELEAFGTVDEGETASPNHTGHYRDPIVLSDGRILAAHDPSTGGVGNLGNRNNPVPSYLFRLRIVGGAKTCERAHIERRLGQLRRLDRPRDDERCGGPRDEHGEHARLPAVEMARQTSTGLDSRAHGTLW